MTTVSGKAMRFGVLAAVLAALLTALLSTAAPAQAGESDDTLLRFGGWLTGEWSNNEQFWQQTVEAKAASAPSTSAPVVRVHRVIRAAGPAAGGGLLFSVQPAAAAATPGKMADTAQPQWLRVRSTASPGVLLQELLAAPTAEKSGSPGCSVTWRFKADEQVYAAVPAAGPCGDDTPLTRGPLLSLGSQKLSADAAISRKLRYFEAWVWIKHAGPSAAADDKRASFTRRVVFHNEGQRTAVKYEDGSDSPYALELAQLTYQNTRKAILKLGLVDLASGKTVAYTWANPEATMIGMNLGWFQAGFTQKAEQPGFAD